MVALGFHFPFIPPSNLIVHSCDLVFTHMCPRMPIPRSYRTYIIVIVICLSKCFPHSDTHTLACISDLLCHIAERSSKHRRHSALLPGSCSSKSCPWSGVVGGQLWLRQASHSIYISLVVIKKKKKKTHNNGVCHWCHVALMSLSTATFVTSAANWTGALCIKPRGSHWITSLRKLCTCATILRQSECSGFLLANISPAPLGFVLDRMTPDTQSASCGFSLFC